MFFKFFKEDPKTEAERKLQELTELLFPPLTVRTDEKGNKFHVDYSADSNLEAALIDLEDGNNDRVTQKTIRKVADRLFDARKLLNVYNDMDRDAKYYVIDISETEELEDIITSTDDHG